MDFRAAVHVVVDAVRCEAEGNEQRVGTRRGFDPAMPSVDDDAANGLLGQAYERACRGQVLLGPHDLRDLAFTDRERPAFEGPGSGIERGVNHAEGFVHGHAPRGHPERNDAARLAVDRQWHQVVVGSLRKSQRRECDHERPVVGRAHRYLEAEWYLTSRPSGGMPSVSRRRTSGASSSSVPVEGVPHDDVFGLGGKYCDDGRDLFDEPRPLILVAGEGADPDRWVPLAGGVRGGIGDARGDQVGICGTQRSSDCRSRRWRPRPDRCR